MPAGELFIAENFLDACRAWQGVIDETEDPFLKDEAGQIAVNSFGSDHTFLGETKVLLKAQRAFMLPDGFSREQQLWPLLQFTDIRLMGELCRVQYVHLNGESIISWMLNNSRSMEMPLELPPDEAIAAFDEGQYDYAMPPDDVIRRPFYLPVNQIEYVLVAA